MTMEGVAVGVGSSISFVRGNVGQYLAGRTKSSGLDPSVQAGFFQRLQDASIPVEMRCTVTAWLSSRTLRHNNENTLFHSMQRRA